MTTYLIKRLFLMVVTLFGITIVAFLIISLSPIDPAAMAVSGGGGSGEDAGSQQADQQAADTIREMREHYNLDKPRIINFDVQHQPKLIENTLRRVLEAEKLGLSDPDKRKEADEQLSEARADVQGMGSLLYPKAFEFLKNQKDNPHLDRVILSLAETFYPMEEWEQEDFSKIPEEDLRPFMQAVEKFFQDYNKLTDERRNDESHMKKYREKVENGRKTFVEWWEKHKDRYDEKKVKETVETFVDGEEKARDQAAGNLRKQGKAAIPHLMPHLFQESNQDLRLRTMQVLARITGERNLYKRDDKAKVKSEVMRSWKRWWERNDMYYRTLSDQEILVRTFTYTQYGTWMGRLFQLDFGNSIRYSRPVLDILKDRVPISLQLSAIALVLVYLLSIPIGIYSATHKGMTMDKALTVTLFILYSLPTFWVAILLIQYVGEPWYIPFYGQGTWPIQGLKDQNYANFTTPEKIIDRLRHLMLPIFCLTYGGLAYVSRQMRAGMLESIRQDYIRTARAKGLPENKVILKHALRNSMIPILTLMAGLLPVLIGGSVIIEYIFSIQGMGLAAFEAATGKDIPLIMAIMFISAVLTLLGILIVDLLYAAVDPRITFD